MQDIFIANGSQEAGKSQASFALKDVILATQHNHPDARFHPHVLVETPEYVIAQIDPAPYGIWTTVDGTGTKPELAERLYEITQDPRVFEGLAHDVVAMIDGDEARFGRFMVGIANVLDVNTATDTKLISALARGLKNACDTAHVALLNGETAELGHRTSGYGETRLNWNAMGVSLVVPDKLLLGDRLVPGQPIVAFREEGIRSNGLTKAREILETGYLLAHGFHSKDEYVVSWLAAHGFTGDLSQVGVLRDLFGHDPREQILPPWHAFYPHITRQLLASSKIYGPVLYEAQGGVDGARNVDMIAAAHISGGGVPEKAKRMVQARGLGAHIDAIFPEPVGIQSLLAQVSSFPAEAQDRLGVTERTASQTWNRGIGFLVATANREEAEKLVAIAAGQGIEAGIAGEIIPEQKIIFRGETWEHEVR